MMAAADEVEKFNLKVVHENFSNSLSGEDDADLEKYLNGYSELYKFCQLMGSVFSFVSNDLKSKIDILKAFKNDVNVQVNFVTVKSMIEYEKDGKMFEKKGYVSGSRTLLRLHRGLDFIRLFLKRVSELQDADKTSEVCKEAYDQTLSKFHPWLIKKGAKVAMYAMPTREHLLRKVCGSTDKEFSETITELPQMLDAIAEVYVRVENLYTKYDLHALP